MTIRSLEEKWKKLASDHEKKQECSDSESGSSFESSASSAEVQTYN